MSAVRLKLKKPKETDIRNIILCWLTLHGGFAFIHDSVGIWDPTKQCFRRRNYKYRKLGVSDILGIWKGRFLAIEVKSATGTLTKEQELFLKDVNQRGGVGFVARSIDDVQDHLVRRGLFEPSRF